MFKNVPFQVLQITTTDDDQTVPSAVQTTHSAPQIVSPYPRQTVHIDRIAACGRIVHRPIGTIFYRMVNEEPTAAGSDAFKPNGKQDDGIYARSKHIEGRDELATMLEFNCCPPQVLQGHNVWGHADMQDYVTAIFERVVAKFPLKLRPTEHERKLWHRGGVDVNHVHLTGNFFLPEGVKMALMDDIDRNNPKGKKRDHLTSISLGFNGDRRSEYQAATVYCKGVELQTKWKRPGKYQTRIIKLMNGAIRVEVKLFRKALKELGLGRVKDWAGVDVNKLFFDTLAKFDIANSIQPVLTEDERRALTKKELAAYVLWLEGYQLADFYSRTTVWKHIKAVKDKVGIDMAAHRRPDKLPAVDMTEVLLPSNIVPVPDYLPGLPNRRYWAPGTAMAEFTAMQAEQAKQPPKPAQKPRDLPDDDELDAIAY